MTLQTTKMAKIKETDNPKYWWGCEETGTLIAVRNIKWYYYLGK